MKIEYFKKPILIKYPMDKYLQYNFNYICQIVKKIEKHYPNKDLVLIGRGSSGLILCTAVSVILTANKKNVRIAYSRKDNENSHGTSLYGIYKKEKNTKYIVIDDFVDTGSTLKFILLDLKNSNIEELDMLILSNRKCFLKMKDFEEYFNKFKFIILNK